MPLPTCPSCHHDAVPCVGDLPPGVTFAGHVLREPLPSGKLYRCDACGLAFRYPLLSKSRYDALYRQAASTVWEYTPDSRRDWNLVRQWLKEHVPSGGSVLDVGCYDGAFFEYLGNEWERYGIEMSTAAVQEAQARGVVIVGEDAMHLSNIGQCFDVVSAFDFIEHMENPLALLRQMMAQTRSGGVVIIGSGNSNARSWRFMGSRYWYCALPEHLAFINEAWCRYAAKTLDLDLVFSARFSHADRRTPWLVVSEMLKNGLYRFFPRAFRALRSHGFGGIDVSLQEDWKDVPPGWSTANDHLLVIFQTP